jgi:hypothetical protein
LQGFGIKVDPKILDNYRVKEGPLDLLYAGANIFSQNAELGRLQWEGMLRHDRDRTRPTTFDGRRWKSESGRLYPVSDPENPAEVEIQRGLAKYELPSFSFVFWPATEVDGNIFVGTPPYQVKWPKDGDKQDIEFFLKQVSTADRFRERSANVTADDSSESDGAKSETSLETQQWFSNLYHATAFSQTPKDTARSHSEESTSIPDPSEMKLSNDAPVMS